MTRKDFELIAECVEAAQKHNPWPTPDMATGAALMKASIARNLMHALSRTNPRFDSARFLAACGVK
jgi:hypothetical protein